MKSLRYVFGVMLVLAILCYAGVASGGGLFPLAQEEQGLRQATHYVVADYKDVADLGTNTPLVVDCPVSAGTLVQFVSYECEMPFYWAMAPTGTVLSGATVKFGTPDSLEAYLASKQCGTNGTVWFSLAAPSVMTPTDLDTNTPTAATVVNSTLYTSATNLRLTLDPVTNKALSMAKSGSIKIFLRKFSPPNTSL